MQDDTEQGTVNLQSPVQSPVVVDETQPPEPIHKKLTRARVVPIISASCPIIRLIWSYAAK